MTKDQQINEEIVRRILKRPTKDGMMRGPDETMAGETLESWIAIPDFVNSPALAAELMTRFRSAAIDWSRGTDLWTVTIGNEITHGVNFARTCCRCALRNVGVSFE